MVLNCSVQDTVYLRWDVPSETNGTEIFYCSVNGNTKVGSSCRGNTNTSYAIIKKFSRGNHHAVNNITSSLTITDINSNMEVICWNQTQKQERYLLHQSTYVARFL